MLQTLVHLSRLQRERWLNGGTSGRYGNLPYVRLRKKFLADAPLTRWFVARRCVRLVLATALLVLSTRFAPQSPSAQTDFITVCASGCNHETIQAAIDSPSTDAGDRIQILDAIHTEAGIAVTKSVTIVGANASGTVVQAHADREAASDRVFTVTDGTSAIIQDMIVRHGKVTSSPAQGGGILNHGSLTLDRVTVAANRALGTDGLGGYAEGGGIYSDGSLMVINSTISGNEAHAGSGG